MSESKLKLITAVVSVAGIILLSAWGLSYIEGWPFFDALWLATISVTTTGYGDILPATLAGRIFLLFVLVIGVGVVAYCLGIIISILVEGQVSKILGRNQMMQEIRKLKNHIIVCGAGRVGSNVAYILRKEKTPYGRAGLEVGHYGARKPVDRAPVCSSRDIKGEGRRA